MPKAARQVWTRITQPQMNSFLLASLAKSAGGAELCGQPVFQNTADPHYQAILKTFNPMIEMLRNRPRMDMQGAQAAAVDRSCLGKLD